MAIRSLLQKDLKAPKQKGKETVLLKSTYELKTHLRKKNQALPDFQNDDSQQIRLMRCSGFIILIINNIGLLGVS